MCLIRCGKKFAKLCFKTDASNCTLNITGRKNNFRLVDRIRSYSDRKEKLYISTRNL